MLVAPNSTKHPAITVAPRRQSTRPPSIRSPTAATATTAIVVATVPSIVPCSQPTAATSEPDPSGSASEAE